MNHSSLLLKYADNLPILTQLEKDVKGFLESFCERNKFLFEGRIKSRNSVSEKLETGMYSSWSDLDDLYACSIIVNLPSDEVRVKEYLTTVFNLNEEKTKHKGGQNKPPDVFRYDSTRAICSLRQPSHIEGVELIYSTSFEVQIRTIFEYAWAKTTHALAYKSPVVDWKRQRLAAQLKAATEQIETLILAFDIASEHISVSKSIGIEEQAKIHNTFKELFTTGAIPVEFEPSDWTRFSMNIYKLLQLAIGKTPTGRSNEPTDKLDEHLDVIRSYIIACTPTKVPKSLSLFQFVSCILFSNENGAKKNAKYNMLITQEMKSLFPRISPPCSVFNLE